MSSSGVSLLQIPEIPMKHIFEYLEFPSILILRKVCRDFRKFIDDTKPASRLTEIVVDVNPEPIHFNLHLPRSPLPIYIDYVKSGDGCLVKCVKEENVKETILENEDFVTVFSKDFDTILKHQKTVLDEFTINSKFSDLKVKERVLENVKKSLKSMRHLLQVNKLEIEVSNHNEILSILPYIDPKSLEQINIYEPSGRYNVVLNFDEIGQLEQWKQAKELWIRGLQLADLYTINLKHFSRIFLGSQKISTEELILLKEIFLCSSTLNAMTIHNNERSRDVTKQKLIESFGQDHLRDENWFFRIPDTNQFLRITQESFHIHFNRIEQSDVPQNAKILN